MLCFDSPKGVFQYKIRFFLDSLWNTPLRVLFWCQREGVARARRSRSHRAAGEDTGGTTTNLIRTELGWSFFISDKSGSYGNHRNSMKIAPAQKRPKAPNRKTKQIGGVSFNRKRLSVRKAVVSLKYRRIWDRQKILSS